MNSKVVTITKLDAARRQLRTALELWFADGEPVSIHVLAYNAHEIIYRTFRRRGHSDLMYDSIVIKDEHRGDFARLLKQDANFFKHFNNNDEEENTSTAFNPESNFMFLVMSVIGLVIMRDELNHAESAFFFWLYLHRPNWFKGPILKKPLPVDQEEQLRALDKAEFYRHYLSVRAREKTS